MKRVLIPWSGGADSTYLILKNLKEGNHVTAFGVRLENNPNQSDREFKSRKIISDFFYKNYPSNFDYKLFVGRIDVGGSTNLILSQPPIWVLFSHYSQSFSEIDEVQIGYVMNDDVISYLEDVRNLWKSYRPFIGTKHPNLEFPLTKTKKYEILDSLPDEIIRNISVCEYYGEENCNCEPCIRHRRELEKTRYYNLQKESATKSNQLEFDFNLN